MAELRCGKVIERFPEIIARLATMLLRFLESIRGIDVAWIAESLLDELPSASIVGKTRVGGVDINKARTRAVMEAAVALSVAPAGFSASDHAARVREILGKSAEEYATRHAAYDLKKLRAKGLISKAPDSTRRYVTTTDGLRAMAGLIVLRDKVLKPLLTYRGRCKPGSKTEATAKIDQTYQAVQRQMQHLLKELRLVA
ncbi:MAG TPA: hypothetical protein VHY91_20490 [Pirellulales bacterium]|nr:hypothetical protein [Pirellulales bacterium]